MSLKETMQAEVFSESDDVLLIKWLESAQVLHQWGSPSMSFPPTKASLVKARSTKKDKRIAYKGTIGHRPVAYGEIGYIDKINCSARLCKILVDPHQRGAGLGTAWVKTLLKICFQELGLNRIELNVYDQNQRAIKCYQRAGFTIEGLLRETYRVEEGFWSVYRLSILRREWAQQPGISKQTKIFNHITIEQ
ncbi:GNAT family protein [uncultured Microscilla sp.]|uniref:GNAT family N-acetyltransferase n=1 Tax=uncultured Microscilla sp. TaxID=432653 RepID=UPI002622728F|nr:GNAT family protein [uncultured Microscilla sp.]